jgi:hypothetical protein
MTIHRSGTMSRRGAHARDTGSTTGIATAVLALLSAGTLASLGLVTADELRGGTSGNLSAPYNDLLPPGAVVVTPAPTPQAPGSGRQGGGSRPVAPFELAAVTGGVDGSGPTLASSGPGEPEVTPPTVAAPVPPAPPGPVFSALDPTPVPSVLAVKHGRRAGHAHAPGQAHKATKPPREDRDSVAPAATPTSLTFLGLTPAVSGGKHARPEHGHPGPGRPAHQAPAGAVDPALPATPPAPVSPADSLDDPSGPGNGHGHAYGHDKA